MTTWEALRAAGDWLGASCVPRWRDAGFVLAAAIDGPALVLSGIGGKVEPGETFRGAALREFREETGCELARLVSPGRVHRLTPMAAGHPVPAGAAALVAESPPAHPTGGTLWIAVYLGLLADPPRQVEKVKFFALVPPSAGAPQRRDELDVIVGDRAVPAGEVLPPAVTEVRAVHTAAAVLSRPGLLAEWWDATSA